MTKEFLKYIETGKADGPAAIVQHQFHLDPFSNTMFLFCSRHRNRLQALLWEGDGFVLLYKCLVINMKQNT